MADKFKYALTPRNLAILGILDDFYDVYCKLIAVYEEHRKQFYEKFGDKALWPEQLEEYSRSDVRKVCTPLISKYSNIFTDEYDKLYTSAYGFQFFQFLDWYKSKPLYIVIEYISFAKFLNEIQYVVTRIIYRRKYKSSPYSLEKIQLDVNLYIQNLVKLKEFEIKYSMNSKKDITNEVLYLFENLSSISCYKNNHPVIPKHFIAISVKENRKIKLPVHYCNYCRKYFIGKKTLSLFEKEFGKCILEKRMESDLKKNFKNFCTESKLHQLGYNVIDGNLTDEERKRLLVYFLNSNCITYLEICSSIEQNIQLFQNSYRHELAVKKWKEDLKFIGEYILSQKV